MDPVRHINCARETKDLKPDAGTPGTVRMSLTGTSFGVFWTSSRQALKTKEPTERSRRCSMMVVQLSGFGKEPDEFKWKPEGLIRYVWNGNLA
jgi:hypothetical protein